MADKTTKDSKFKNWLDGLQQESWQLELLISGFAIFAVFQAFEPFGNYMTTIAAKNNGEIYFILIFILAIGVSAALAILAFNLSIHILLRGLWIGALGLRYFSGDIDFEELNYSQKFEKYLKKRIKSFDHYIAKLEDYCSLIFSVTFLIIFFIFSFLILFSIIAVIAYSTDNYGDNVFLLTLRTILLSAIAIGCLLTLIDFFTQGALKKKRWTSFFYFPIYRLFSRISFSFVYRPILYNFLDNKKGRWIIGLMVPFYILLAILLSVEVQQSNYNSNEYGESVNYIYRGNYEDLIKDNKKMYVYNASIPSKIIRQNPLQLFIVNQIDFEDAVFTLNPSLKPDDDIRGLQFVNGVTVSSATAKVNLTDFDHYLKSLSEIITVSIDTTKVTTNFVVVTNNKEQDGIETMVEIDSLKKGRHTLDISAKKFVKDSLVTYSIAKFPFWYYPE